MSSPLERIAPTLLARAREGSERLAREAGAVHTNFRPFLGILTAFWIYVAISNLMYANNMQASLSSMKVEHVFAPWDARLLQHLILYPLLILCMWRSLRMGWQPLRRALPIQLSWALGFSVLASPALVLGECITKECHLFGAPSGSAAEHVWPTWPEYFAGPGIPTWVASATNMLVSYGFALALLTGFAFYQRLRDSQVRSQALERALTQANLAALRMQLSPHTLFNLLHTIRGQIAWDPAAAQAMVVQLGDLLRRLLSAGEREFSRLSDELQFTTSYLELQQRRFPDRLTIMMPERAHVPPVWVPSLILQPLVENAVLHGLSGHEGQVTIRVEALVSGETLLLRVLNDTTPGRAFGRPGIGLANVRERLAVQFGERASFTAGPASEGFRGGAGWLAEIRMPLLRDGPEEPRTADAEAAN